MYSQTLAVKEAEYFSFFNAVSNKKVEISTMGIN
jgi:hypothetical protein